MYNRPKDWYSNDEEGALEFERANALYDDEITDEYDDTPYDDEGPCCSDFHCPCGG